MENPLLNAILTVSVLLAVGLTLRVKVRAFRALFIPASVIAGAIGFVLAQVTGNPGVFSVPTGAIVGELLTWPKWLIAVVFAGLLLEGSTGRGFGEALRRGARSGILAWVIILGQIAIGLAVWLLLVRPTNPQVPASFGQLLEVSWAGGHGTSSAMGQVYAAQGFPQGKDLAFFLATVGLIYGVISGLFMVNLAVRRGWTSSMGGPGRIAVVTGLEPSVAAEPQVIGHAKTRGEVIDPLAWQIVLLAIAFAVGVVYQTLFIRASSVVLGANDPADKNELVDFVGNLPLFLFALLGGWTVRKFLQTCGLGRLIDGRSVQRLTGVAMEFLIVAAVATTRVDALSAFFVPVISLLILAAVWTAVCLLVIAPRILPRAYWLELGLLNYGFATANTPQGLMLLRIVDPELRSGAAEDYAVAAPLSAPFVGGGIVTFTLPVLLASASGAWWVLCGSVAAVAALVYLGISLSRQSAE